MKTSISIFNNRPVMEPGSQAGYNSATYRYGAPAINKKTGPKACSSLSMAGETGLENDNLIFMALYNWGFSFI